MDALAIRNLTYEVPEKKILKNINMSVPAGALMAIMGQSGCGKTSLLKCIAGLARPSSGQIEIDGTDIVGLSESEIDQIRLKMGLVFQYAALFDSLNVYDNVSFGLKHHKQIDKKSVANIVAERLEDVGMSGTEKLFPSQLSGGMQKRVGLARALAMEPSLLLYDEPTSGLDPVIARNIDDLIVETKGRHKVTSIIVSHDIRSIFRIADFIGMMVDGELIAFLNPRKRRCRSLPFDPWGRETRKLRKIPIPTAWRPLPAS